MQLFKVVEYTYSFEFCPGTNRGLSGYETFYTPAAKLCCGRGGVTGRRQSQEKILKIEDEKHPPQLGWRNKAVCHKKPRAMLAFAPGIFLSYVAHFFVMFELYVDNLHDLELYTILWASETTQVKG